MGRYEKIICNGPDCVFTEEKYIFSCKVDGWFVLQLKSGYYRYFHTEVCMNKWIYTQQSMGMWS